MFGKKKDEETKPETPVEETKPAVDGLKVEAENGGEAKPSNTAGDSGASVPTDDSTPADAPEEADSAIGESSEPGKSSEPEKAAEPEKSSEPDWKTLYAITRADFENYKKRAARDREDVYRYAESDILKDVLPSVDNLSLALANAKDPENEFVKGVRLVYDGLLKALDGHGAKPMEDLVGKELDPNYHEAIASLPHAEIAEGRITTVVKTGWLLNDKLLRAAQVVTSAGAPEAK